MGSAQKITSTRVAAVKNPSVNQSIFPNPPSSFPLACFTHWGCLLRRSFVFALVLALVLGLMPSLAFSLEENPAAQTTPLPSIQEVDVPEISAKPVATAPMKDTSATEGASPVSSPVSSPELNLADGSVRLDSQNKALRYSRDGGLTWTVYAGSLTLVGTASSNARIVVESGNHALIFNNVTIPATSTEEAALSIQYAKGTRSYTTLTLQGTNTLAGGANCPGILVNENSYLQLFGDGTLNVQGGANAPAMGADALVNGCGALSFEHTGTINATSGSYAPAIGDPTSDTSTMTGSMYFLSGTVNLVSGGTTDVAAKSVTANGGSVGFSKNPPKTYFMRDQSGIDYACVAVKIAGLPGGIDLTQSSLNLYGDPSMRPFVAEVPDSGRDDGDSGSWYCVKGISPTTEGTPLNIFASETGTKEGGVVLFTTAGGAAYEGVMHGSAAQGYTVQLQAVQPPESNPTVDIGVHPLTLNAGSAQYPQYSIDGGANWRSYSGAITATGAYAGYEPGARIRAIDGTHTLRLSNCTIGTGIDLDGSSRVTMTLIGNNAVTTFSQTTAIRVAQKAQLSINGKGSLSAIGKLSGAGIGSNKSEMGGSITINGGKISAQGGESGAAGIGSGFEGSAGDIAITGGTVIATGGRSAAGIGAGSYGKITTITLTGGTIQAQGGELAPGIGMTHRAEPAGFLTITGGTIQALGGEGSAGIAGGIKTTITGGSINGMKQKPPKSKARATVLPDRVALIADGGTEKVATGSTIRGGIENPVNQAGEALYPVLLSSLPKDTSLGDFHLRLLDLGFDEKPGGYEGYGVFDVATDSGGSLYFFLSEKQASDKLVTASWEGRQYFGYIGGSAQTGYEVELTPTEAALYYEGHTFEGGWGYEDQDIPWSFDGQVCGNPTGNALTALRLETSIADLTITYAVNNGNGWSSPVKNGDIAGEMSAPLQGMRASLSGAQAKHYTLWYRTFIDDVGWMAWACDGAASGSTGHGYAIRGYQATILPVGTLPPAEPPSATKYAYLVKGGVNEEGVGGVPGSSKSLASTGDTLPSPALLVAGVGMCVLVCTRILFWRRRSISHS